MKSEKFAKQEIKSGEISLDELDQIIDADLARDRGSDDEEDYKEQAAINEGRIRDLLYILSIDDARGMPSAPYTPREFWRWKNSTEYNELTKNMLEKVRERLSGNEDKLRKFLEVKKNYDELAIEIKKLLFSD